MPTFSSNQVAKRLGIATKTLTRYIAQKKVSSPKIIEVGGITVHAWTEAQIETLRELLPKIANGRKTRYQKQRKHQRRRDITTKRAAPDAETPSAALTNRRLRRQAHDG